MCFPTNMAAPIWTVNDHSGIVFWGRIRVHYYFLKTFDLPKQVGRRNLVTFLNKLIFKHEMLIFNIVVATLSLYF